MVLRGRIQTKDADQLKVMRRAGLVVAEGLAAMTAAAKPGVTTRELDQIACEVLAKHSATSNFLNYGADWGIAPYPASVCTSVNNVIVHGIPNDEPLKAGDIISIDFGAIIDGWHGDAARTVIVGGAGSDVDQRLDQTTERAMWAGVAAAWAGHRVGDISHAIEQVADTAGFDIVAEFTGHGIGTEMHMAPDVPNFGRPGRGAKLSFGMTICIEPILTAGSAECATLADDWTVVTVDGSRAAHWENTVAITRDGLWILTEPDGGEAKLAELNVPFAPLAD